MNKLSITSQYPCGLNPQQPHMESSLSFHTASPALHKFSFGRFNSNRVALSNRPKRFLPRPFHFHCIIPRGTFSTGRERNVLIIAKQPLPSPTNTTRSFGFPPSRETSFASPFVILRKIAYDVLFPLLIIFATIWLTSTLLRRLQRKQLSLQKSQPRPIQFNLLLDLNRSEDSLPLDKKDVSPASEQEIVSDIQILDIDHQDTVRSDKNPPQNYKEVSTEPRYSVPSKVQLQLSKKSNGSSGSVRKHHDPSYPLKAPTPESVEPVENDDEAMFVGALIDAMTVASDSNLNDGERKAADVLSSALNGVNISNSLKSSMKLNVVSRLVSTAVDNVAIALEKRDTNVMAVLGALSNTMRAAQVVAPGLMLNYVGNKLCTETSLEDIYRRYAVYCMSTEQRLVEDLESLNQMQRFLDIRESKAKEINVEIANGMYQVAVSAAMASGSVTDEDRRRLETLKESFGKHLTDTAADSITSEVMVMRTMYALQQLLVQEEDVSDQDVLRLRKMCQDLGGDIEEVVHKADILGNTLGVEVKDFALRLRSALSGSRIPNKPPHSTSTQ